MNKKDQCRAYWIIQEQVYLTNRQEKDKDHKQTRMETKLDQNPYRNRNLNRKKKIRIEVNQNLQEKHKRRIQQGKMFSRIKNQIKLKVKIHNMKIEWYVIDHNKCKKNKENNKH